MKILLSLVILHSTLVTAQSVIAPLKWRVETSRVQSVDLELYRGETVALQPRFDSFATPLQLPTNSVVRLLYRSPNMAANTYHEVVGTHHADAGRVSVTWSPAADNGASVYDYSLVAEDGSAAIVRAYGKILMRGTVYGQAGTPVTLTNVWTHIADTDNPHQVTKGQIGLGNVDNTSDANKPISSATQSALDDRALASDLSDHETDTDNPHQVTAGQVGTYTSGEIDTLLENVEPVWGNITGTLGDQGDLQGALDTKLESVETTGGPLYPHFLTLESQLFHQGVVTGTTNTNNVDAVIQVQTISPASTHYQLTHAVYRDTTNAGITYSSSSPSVATVSSAGYVSWVSDGEAVITASVSDFSRSLSLAFSSGLPINTTNIVAGVSPYWRHAVTNPIDTALTADAGAMDNELFDVRDWSTHTYTRNASCWAYAATGGTAPWTGVPVWATWKTSTALGQFIRGTLISPNVIAFAWHNAPPIGSQFKYLGTDNIIYTRTMTARIRLGTTDAGVGLLDSALPAEVQPVKLMDPNFITRLFAPTPNGYQLPGIVLNRNLQVSVMDVHSYGVVYGAPLGFNWYRSQVPLRTPYFQTLVVGDSGQPGFLVTNGQLVLLNSWHTPSSGSSLAFTATLTDAVAALGGTQPTMIDLSSYPENGPPAP